MKFGVVIFKEVEELDFVGPWEMLAMWSKYAQGPEHRLIVGKRIEPVTCAGGLSVVPDTSFSDCPTLDYLLVPGGPGTRNEENTVAVIEFISRAAANCKAILSVCTGSFLLHKAGLLSGKKATTHWASLEGLRTLGDVEVVEQRFVHDGQVWTSAGVSSGMDMILAFIADVDGEAAAGKVQSYAEYYPSPVKYGAFARSIEAPGYIKSC